VTALWLMPNRQNRLERMGHGAPQPRRQMENRYGERLARPLKIA
jgi:hypothetical protein